MSMSGDELNRIEQAARLDGNYHARQLLAEVRRLRALLSDRAEELKWMRQALLSVDWSWTRAEEALDALIDEATKHPTDSGRAE